MIQIENAFWFSGSILVGFLVGILGSLFTTEFFRYEDLKDDANKTTNNEKKRAKSKTMLIVYSLLIIAIFLIYFIIFCMSAIYLENQNTVKESQNVTIVNNYYLLDKDTFTHHLSNTRLENEEKSKQFYIFKDLSQIERGESRSSQMNIWSRNRQVGRV